MLSPLECIKNIPSVTTILYQIVSVIKMMFMLAETRLSFKNNSIISIITDYKYYNYNYIIQLIINVIIFVSVHFLMGV
jgi:hypothetical protein